MGKAALVASLVAIVAISLAIALVLLVPAGPSYIPSN